MKTRLGMTSTEFLKDYTVPYEFDKDSIAGIKFRPVEGGTACRFMKPEGCDIYSDRPTACRYYPVALLSMRKQDEYVDRDSYAIVKEDHCKGHEVNRCITIADYRKEQGLGEYDELARGWRQLVLKKKSSGPTIGKPSLRSRQLFFMACYDIDRFREFVFADSFTRLFELKPEEREAFANDDVALLQFAFRFLRQVLFGEESIALNAEAAQERLARVQEKRLIEEREAAKKRALEDEQDTGADEGFD
jgi:Fe-S-cluster containining protein